MTKPKLTKLEMKVMELLWRVRSASIGARKGRVPARRRAACTPGQAVGGRVEAEQAGGRARKVGNFHVFEAMVSRGDAQRKLIDDLLTLFGGSSQPVMAHLIESGKLTMDDVKEAEKLLREMDGKEKTK